MKGEVWREYRQLEEDADNHTDDAKAALERLRFKADDKPEPALMMVAAVEALTSGLLAVASRLEAQTYADRHHLNAIVEMIDEVR